MNTIQGRWLLALAQAPLFLLAIGEAALNAGCHDHMCAETLTLDVLPLFMPPGIFLGILALAGVAVTAAVWFRELVRGAMLRQLGWMAILLLAGVAPAVAFLLLAREGGSVADGRTVAALVVGAAVPLAIAGAGVTIAYRRRAWGSLSTLALGALLLVGEAVGVVHVRSLGHFLAMPLAALPGGSALFGDASALGGDGLALYALFFTSLSLLLATLVYSIAASGQEREHRWEGATVALIRGLSAWALWFLAPALLAFGLLVFFFLIATLAAGTLDNIGGAFTVSAQLAVVSSLFLPLYVVAVLLAGEAWLISAAHALERRRPPRELLGLGVALVLAVVVPTVMGILASTVSNDVYSVAWYWVAVVGIGVAAGTAALAIASLRYANALPDVAQTDEVERRRVAAQQAFRAQVEAVLSEQARESLHLTFGAGLDATAIITLDTGRLGWITPAARGRGWELTLPDGHRDAIPAEEQALLAATQEWRARAAAPA